MPIVSGPVKSKKVKTTKSNREITDSDSSFCNICFKAVSPAECLTCLFPKCGAKSHILCLAENFTGGSGDGTCPNGLLPVRGTCPTCNGEELWGDLIRKRRGCYEELSEEEDDYDDGL